MTAIAVGLLLSIGATSAVLGEMLPSRRAVPLAQSAELPLDFDIPSQPLPAALKVFGKVTNLDLFYESAATVGVMSVAVRGVFTPSAALRLLLRGTTLSVATYVPGTMTLVSRRPETAAEMEAAKATIHPFSAYFAALQTDLQAAFCQTAEATSDSDEVLVQLWINRSGAIERAELLSSTGSRARDLMYVDAVRSLRPGPPPRDLPQPVVLMILPRSLGGACRQRAWSGGATP